MTLNEIMMGAALLQAGVTIYSLHLSIVRKEEAAKQKKQAEMWAGRCERLMADMTNLRERHRKAAAKVYRYERGGKQIGKERDK